MTDRPLNLRIEVDPGDDADAEERDDAERALSRELLELDVDTVGRPAAEAPPGTRAGETVALGTLLVTLGPHALAAVGGTVRQWVAGRGNRRVALELDGDRIELGSASAVEQRQLIDAFVARHARP